MLRRSLLALTLGALAAFAIPTKTQSQFPSPIPKVTSLPATCQPTGQTNVVFKTTATIGLYECLSANTWSYVEAGSGGSATWGAITGTISNQTDLQTALNLKANLAGPTFTGNVGIEAAGVRFTAADGVLTLLGLGNGNDESLTIDLDNAAANAIALASGTGADLLTWTGDWTFDQLALGGATIPAVGVLNATGTMAAPGTFARLTPTATSANNDGETFLGIWVTHTANPTTDLDQYHVAIQGRTETETNNVNDYTAAYGTEGIVDHLGTGILQLAYGLVSGVTNRDSGTIGDAYGLDLSIRNLSTGGVATGYGVNLGSPVNSGGGAFNTYYGFYQQNVRGITSTSSYPFWYDGTPGADCAGAGVTRINHLGIFAHYNPCFTKYTVDAVNFERLIAQWGDTGVFGTDNIAYLGVEVGGTGTNRVLALLGSQVSAMSVAGTLTTFNAATVNANALLNLPVRQSVTVDGVTTFAITSSYITLACTGTETINTITGGTTGTLLYIDHGDTECTLASDADPTAANAMALLASDVGAVNKTIVLMHNGTYWQELSESDNQ